MCTWKEKQAVFICIILFAVSLTYILSNYLPVESKQRRHQTQTDLSSFHRVLGTTRNRPETQRNYWPEFGLDTSSGEPRVGLHGDKESSNFNTQTATLSQTDDEVSCYPRLFAVDRDRVSSSSFCGGPRVPVGQDSNPVQHLFFLKTHKTGSTTLASIFNRYALVHNLSVAIRKNLRNHDASRYFGWISDIRPLPQGVDHYDMITDHVRFDEKSVRYFLPNDTMFVSVVREPLDRFVSAFYFYRDRFKSEALQRIPGPNPVLTYLSDMKRWDLYPGTDTHSKMFRDFGLDFKRLKEPQYLQGSLRYLSQVFHLVLLADAFDESIVLLRRALSWTLPDLLYVNFNTGKTRPVLKFTEQQKNEFQKHRQEEYALYRHFRSLFYEKVRAEGESFVEEVRVFQTMRTKVNSFCLEITEHPGDQELRVESTKFSERFRVTLDDCRLLMRESSSIRNTWFENLMIQRMQDWEEAWNKTH